MTTSTYFEALSSPRTGDLERFTDCGTWRLPLWVYIDRDPTYGSVLVSTESGTQRIRDAPGFCEQFATLHSKDDSAILDYAKRWGLLGLCKHLLPASHGPCKFLRTPYNLIEPLRTWRAFSAAADAMLAIKAHKNAQESVPQHYWHDLYRWPPPEEAHLSVYPFWPAEADGEILSERVNLWLEIGGVRPHYDWPGTIRFKVGGLFGALAVQLLLAVSGLESWVICSNPACRQSYLPARRRPKHGQRHFCPACRAKGVPKRLATRDYRARRLEKLTLGESLGTPKQKSG